MENVLITGGTGLIGKQLSALLLQEGYSVSLFSRSARKLTGKIQVYHWDIERAGLDEDAIKNADHIIHLAGASVAGGKWTKKRKEELYTSRIGSALMLLKTLNKTSHHVKTFISASAVGYYGDGGERWLTENAPGGNDFLANLCSDWESECANMQACVTRTVTFRTGIVLAREGGSLPELAKSMSFGVAAYLGNGKQFLSWIHFEDLCRLYLYGIRNKDLAGIYNAVAPEPVTNLEMIKAIRKAKGNYSLVLPVPAFALKLALGEMSQAILAGQRCSSEKLIKTGFEFKYPELKRALENLYK